MHRTLHIVDIENLAGADHASLDAVVRAGAAYRRVAEIGPMDQFIVGTNMNPQYRLAVGLDWVEARVVSGHGPNGADRALLATVDPDWVIVRGFSRVVIGSGDQCFASLGATLKRAGVTVQVIGRTNQTHCSLWPASHGVTVLPLCEASSFVVGVPAPGVLGVAA